MPQASAAALAVHLPGRAGAGSELVAPGPDSSIEPAEWPAIRPSAYEDGQASSVSSANSWADFEPDT